MELVPSHSWTAMWKSTSGSMRGPKFQRPCEQMMGKDTISRAKATIQTWGGWMKEGVLIEFLLHWPEGVSDILGNGQCRVGMKAVAVCCAIRDVEPADRAHD